MRILNIKAKNTKKETKLIYDFYKDSLNNILDSNIDNILANTIILILAY